MTELNSRLSITGASAIYAVVDILDGQSPQTENPSTNWMTNPWVTGTNYAPDFGFEKQAAICHPNEQMEC